MGEGGLGENHAKDALAALSGGDAQRVGAIRRRSAATAQLSGTLQRQRPIFSAA